MLFRSQPIALSRDALLFSAGKAAATRTPSWLWPSATGAFACMSLSLAAFLVSPAPAEVRYVERERIVYVERTSPQNMVKIEESPTPTSPSTEVDDAIRERARQIQVRRDVLRWGIEMLPASKASNGPSPDVSAREMTHWLSLPPGTFALPSQSKNTTKKGNDE